MLEDDFAETMHKDLDEVQAALNTVDSLCYRVPQISILKEFNELCKPHQLFVQLPHVCAMVYAHNPKKGNFTGFFLDIPKTGQFDHQQFLLANALAGPNSIIKSIVNKRGKN